jgi:hypothetical protein
MVLTLLLDYGARSVLIISGAVWLNHMVISGGVWLELGLALAGLSAVMSGWVISSGVWLGYQQWCLAGLSVVCLTMAGLCGWLGIDYLVFMLLLLFFLFFCIFFSFFLCFFLFVFCFYFFVFFLFLLLLLLLFLSFLFFICLFLSGVFLCSKQSPLNTKYALRIRA